MYMAAYKRDKWAIYRVNIDGIYMALLFIM